MSLVRTAPMMIPTRIAMGVDTRRYILVGSMAVIVVDVD